MFLRISLTILALLVLSTGTRMYRLAHYGLSPDETVTLCVINGYEATGGNGLKVLADLPETFTRAEIRQHKTYRNVVNATIRDNGNSMAYNIMLSWWTKVFGNTNYSLRFLSLVFGVLTTILGYYFARQLFNERTAVIAAVLLCLHPLMIEYSQLARAYVPATFFALLSTYSLYQVAVSKRHLWLHIPLYVMGAAMCLLCHYLVIYVLLAHVVLVLFFHSHKKAMLQYAFMGIAIAGLFSIWLFNGGLEGKKWMDKQNQAFEQRAEKSMSESADAGSIKTIAYRTGLNAVKIFGSEFQTLALSSAIVFLYLLLPAALLFFALKNIRKSEYFRQAMFVLIPIGLYFVFTIFMAIQSGHTTSFDVRYTCFIMPFACIILAFGFDRMMTESIWIKRASFAGLSGLFAIMIVSAFPHFVFDIIEKEGDPFPYHHAADFIEKRSAEGDEILFSSDKDALLSNLYINRKEDVLQRIDTTMEKNKVVLRKNNVDVAAFELAIHR